jgi:hypothetical protein
MVRVVVPAAKANWATVTHNRRS